MKKTICCLFLLPLIAFGASAQLSLREDNINEILSALTLEEKAALIVGTENKSFTGVGSTDLYVPGAAGTTSKIERLGITPVVLADGPMGLRIEKQKCTKFPISTLLAASWDLQLMEEVGKAIGNEVKEHGVDVILGPGVNLQRNPLCGRNFEYYSEDPLLAGEMAAAYINGVQSNGVGCCLKHYAVNNQEVNRLYLDARLDDRTLRELYIKNFEIAVKKSNPWSIMTSYNYVNGRYAAEHDQLVNGILRGEWGYEGTVMTDWGAGYDSKAIVRSGNDMIQPGATRHFKAIVDGVNDGSLSIEAVDAAARNVLKLVLRSPRYKGYAYSNKPDFEANSAITRRAGAEGMVLIKNKSNALPLKAGEKVALFGVSSYAFITGGTGAADVHTSYTVDLRQGLLDAGFRLDEKVDGFYLPYMKFEKERCARIDWDNNHRHWFVDAERPLEVVPQDVIAAASKTADRAVVTIGRIFGEGKDRSLQYSYCLTKEEIRLISEVADAFHRQGKQLVVILDTGGIVDMSWDKAADAVLYSWLPGCEGGHSVCDVLSGSVCPSGRLPMTIPARYEDDPTADSMPQINEDKHFNYSFFRPTYGDSQKRYELPGIDYLDYTEGVFMGYRHYVSKGVRPAYPFGYGLSYTSFKYSDMKVEKDSEGNFTVSVRVTNTGSTAGREVVQLYVHAPGKDMAKPERELRGFAKTGLLAAGESCTVCIPVEKSSLASWNEGWQIEEGSYTFMIAKDSFTRVLKKKIKI